MRFLAASVAFLLAGVASAESVDLTAEEFKMFQHYRNAMGDPRVQKMKPEQQLPAIAKDAGFKVKDLEKAIARGEAAGNVKEKCDASVKEALAKTELSSRVSKAYVDASDPHAVGYVQWLNENPAQLEEEASMVAAAVASSCPVLSTIQVWAQDKASPNARVFQALISASAAAKIKPERAKDFADTRYIRLFEKVKNVANGDDLTGATGDGSAKSAP